MAKKHLKKSNQYGNEVKLNKNVLELMERGDIFGKQKVKDRLTI